jgi:hypothetical protein
MDTKNNGGLSSVRSDTMKSSISFKENNQCRQTSSESSPSISSLSSLPSSADEIPSIQDRSTSKTKYISDASSANATASGMYSLHCVDICYPMCRFLLLFQHSRAK